MSGFLDGLPPHARFVLGAVLFLLGGGGFGWAAAKWHRAGAVEAAEDAGYEEGREDMARELAGWAAGDEQTGEATQETPRAWLAEDDGGREARTLVEARSEVLDAREGEGGWEPDGRLAAYARLPQPAPDLTGWPAWSTEAEPERELAAFWLDFYQRDAAVGA